MKRLILSLTTLAILWVAGCGSGSTPVPPPPVGGFTNASLKGQYAFSMSGSEVATSGGLTSSFFARVGSFIADGNGNITGGVEDVNLANGTSNFLFTSGTYAIDPDGRGTLKLTNSTGTLEFSITLASTNNGFMVQMPPDGLSTTSGNFRKQDTSAFTLSGISGAYAFDFSGLNPSAAFESIVGQFATNSNGVITSGQEDDNDASLPAPVNAAITGTYAQDPLFPSDMANFGRGVATFGGVTYVFYIVDRTFTFVFYLTSPTQGFLQDESPNIIADGTVAGQPAGTISNTSLAGKYAVNWSGIASTDLTTDEEDFVGQLSLASGSFTGTVDLNEFASAKQFFNAPINGTLALSADPTGHNSFTVNLQTNPSTKLTFFAYVANNNTIFLMGTQQNVRVITGVMTSQQ